MAKRLKKLLVISWALPPFLSPRSIQVARTLKQLAELGWEIDVITARRSRLWNWSNLDFDLEKKYNSTYTAYSVDGYTPFNWKLSFPRIGNAPKDSPDEHEQWTFLARQAGERLIRSKHYDLILSFAQPWSSHRVGLSLKESTQLPWVAHFSDPWADNPYYKKWNASQRAKMQLWEEEVIRKADAVVFTNLQTSDLVMRKYRPAWKKKAFVVPHGFEEYKAGRSSKQIVSSQFLVVHTGNLYGLRTPEHLIRALGMLKETNRLDQNLKVKFIGFVKNTNKYLNLAKQLGVEQYIEFTGRLSYEKTTRIASQANVLLLIDAPSEGESLFLPSKLVDYLRFNKPILGLTPLKGAAADLLETIECPIVAPENVKGIAENLAGMLNEHKRGELNISNKFKRGAANYNIQKTTSMLNNVLKEVATRAAS